jgi:hypothetical protein
MQSTSGCIPFLTRSRQWWWYLYWCSVFFFGLVFFFFFGITGVWTQAGPLLSHTCSLFALIIVAVWSHFAQASLDCDPILCFPLLLGWQVCATMPSFFFHWNEVLETYSLGWPPTVIFLFSASQVAGIIGMSFQHPAKSLFLKKKFGSTGVWTHSSTLARQMLYHLSYISTLFAIVVFQVDACGFCLVHPVPRSTY